MGLLPFERRTFKVLTRYDSETNPEYGMSPYKRTITEHLRLGMLNLDKPSGPTSHEVTEMVRRVLGVKLAGHGGTLDPRVTGVLPVALESATRILRVFLKGGKEYVVEMKLHKLLPKDKVLEGFKHFTGKIMQLPPIKSNVKRVLRQREIYYIDFLEMKGNSVLFKAGCEAGTYIRKLCTDFGDYLGVKAHMQELRRTKASSFKEENSVSLFNLQDAKILYTEKGDESLLRKYIRPVEEATMHLRKIWLSDGAAAAVSYGANLMLPGVVKLDSDIEKGDLVALFSLKEELVALGTALMNSDEMMKNDKGETVHPETVILNPNVYPRSWERKFKKE
ncbi:putative tRNA pseudouridine synthase B [Candidatus Tiddalikarchaeum anstoanum]|nr:putative tRNA pseudouridine synthase B [Candidatus Tiddalikarchaeum anstoanum]